ncbi:2322_t:CDS:2 [Rhizophagus irregularis]|nr:2322_t:CDS:2 [Rhizophagus irregularis]
MRRNDQSIHSVSERDISAQETDNLLLGIPLYHSSRTFITLNLHRGGIMVQETCRILTVIGRNAKRISVRGILPSKDPPSHYDLLGPAVDNEEEIAEEEELMEEKNEDDQTRLDDSRGDETKCNIECSSDLGTRDMDRNHDWVNDGKQHYDDSDLADANNFLQQATGD